ncbi:hypothetical protein GCM10023195_37910 [Actinoallomurus liliacearum]|uniref:Uncharacterized protein n=1 Tax=Actinoallomurus liliacearum TaxID=1080073 RepID=A0ABP8TMR3_9ACTN
MPDQLACGCIGTCNGDCDRALREIIEQGQQALRDEAVRRALSDD